MSKLFGDYYKGMLAIVVVVMAALVGFAVAIPEQFNALWNGLNNGICLNFGWWYIILANSICFFLIFLLCSKYGKVRIGKITDRPEYSTFSWIAMLFSSNVGVGLIFWGVAEPILHLMETPYLVEAGSYTADGVRTALSISTMHWGITAWGPCTLAALAIGFAAYRHGQPLTMAGALYGLLGDKVQGKIGKVIDCVSVFATIAGICTTIGLGVMSVSYGANYLFGIENSVLLNVVILVLVVATFLLSSSVGIGKGIKRLSSANVYLSIAMMVLILAFGPTRFILNATVMNIGGYLENYLHMAFFTDPVAESGWLSWWTVFYWGWWLAWTPFVGGFIAKISKGRTVREFLVGALIAPTILTVVWFGILGGAAIHSQINNIAPMYETISQYSESGLYVLFSTYPGATFLSILVLVNMIIFVCTSADAASFYCAACINKGSITPSVGTKIFLGIIIGVAGLILMQTGGLKSLQTVSIVF
ncbi:MAG: BCCT family transporter, partial [Clostridiales bacterium]